MYAVIAVCSICGGGLCVLPARQLGSFCYPKVGREAGKLHGSIDLLDMLITDPGCIMDTQWCLSSLLYFSRPSTSKLVTPESTLKHSCLVQQLISNTSQARLMH